MSEPCPSNSVHDIDRDEAYRRVRAVVGRPEEAQADVALLAKDVAAGRSRWDEAASSFADLFSAEGGAGHAAEVRETLLHLDQGLQKGVGKNLRELSRLYADMRQADGNHPDALRDFDHFVAEKLGYGDAVPLVCVEPRAPEASAEPADPSCPPEMVHVKGEYCPEVEQKCVEWMDPPGGRYSQFRCAQYAQPTQCLSPRVEKDFCIDRDEYAPPGTDLPANQKSWTDAKAICESEGKRVCTESEWQFACEGEEMLPYPYGYAREPNACNADRMDIYEPGRKGIKDLRARQGTHPDCVSPFGVRDLTGNLEEFVTIDGSVPPRPAMKGAWWQPSRNNCRARQTAHDAHYSGRETGFRCCSEPQSQSQPQPQAPQPLPAPAPQVICVPPQTGK